MLALLTRYIHVFSELNTHVTHDTKVLREPDVFWLRQGAQTCKWDVALLLWGSYNACVVFDRPVVIALKNCNLGITRSDVFDWPCKTEYLWFYKATVGTPCLGFISEIWDAYCEFLYVSDRDVSRVLSFIKVKHNGKIGCLDLTSSGFVKVAINAVTLALCYFDISVAVFVFIQFGLFVLF